MTGPGCSTRFGPTGGCCTAHLILYGFAYPAERDKVPGWVHDELSDRLNAEQAEDPPPDRVCRGSLLAATQYIRT